MASFKARSLLAFLTAVKLQYNSDQVLRTYRYALGAEDRLSTSSMEEHSARPITSTCQM